MTCLEITLGVVDMGDRIDDVLRVLSTPDWISPAMHLAKDMQNAGNIHTFYVDLYGSFSAADLGKILNKVGVYNWGRYILYQDELICVSVRKEDAEYAQSVLTNEGVPLLGGELPHYIPDNRGTPLPNIGQVILLALVLGGGCAILAQMIGG